MKSIYKTLAVCGAISLAATALASAQDSSLVSKAKSEGTVTIYTSTDISEAQPMIDAFKKKYPGVEVNYNDLGTVGAYNKTVAEAAAKQVTADVVWTSAMDLQMKLASGGYFQKVDLPQKTDIPDWADYKDMLYATSIEPIGMIYNKKLVSEDKVPHSREELIKFVQSDVAKGKVATYDPEKSGTGFLFDTNDVQNNNHFWELADAFGKANGKTYSSTGAMKETVVSGENVLAFNLIGSYALNWIKQSKNLGLSFDKEHTAAFSRLAGLTNGAPHPAAGQLFLEFLLSKDGQSALAKQGLPSLRTDVEVGYNIDTINKRVGGNIQPIKVDEGLLTYMDPMKRVKFLKKWQKATR
jgi:iron(III) transport system substrate-binding protein